MPTYDKEGLFDHDFDRLTPQQQRAFLTADRKLVEDLRRGVLRPGLRVKRVQRFEGVWEMTWAPDGRATFRYGSSIRPGDPHIVWRRIGGHEILDNL